jgi:DNA mismatch endonuclease (patch repair protein)
VTVDRISKQRRSEIMSSIRSKGSRQERIVRSVLHRLGYRFRLHRTDLPGKPDVVLPKYRTVVLLHGCFWHGCDKCDRGRRVPKSNTAFWVKKVQDNRRRDEVVREALLAAGWHIVVVWACETEDLDALTERLRAIRARAPARPRPPGRSSTSSRAAGG